MTNGNGKTAWLITGIAVSIAFNLFLGGMTLQRLADRKQIDENAKMIRENSNAIHEVREVMTRLTENQITNKEWQRETADKIQRIVDAVNEIAKAKS